ncbi:MAG: PD-(D/E)XK nuclease family protein [Nitrospirae bacterium]|nr:PD-(D/E)XK nuclease family protein [Nitrospirota bacterium]MBF0542631.1 PD-(D/E)XK nuclease family protein [Nitrospirota bacterium]
MNNISELRHKPHLSVSAINDYIDCGFLYKFGRIDNLKPDFEADSLIFGKTIHRVLAYFYQEKRAGCIPDLDVLTDVFNQEWDYAVRDNNIKYKKGHDVNTLLNQGIDLLTAYYNDIPDNNFKVLAIEEAFSFNIDGLSIPIIGVIDLVEEDEAGTIIITDFKTSSKAYSIDDVDNNLQLTVYNMAARANGYAEREILLRFDVMIKTKQVKFEQYYTSRAIDDEKKVIRKVQQVWEGINKGIFIPNDTSWKCNGCSYKSHCEKWFDGGN